MKTAALDGHLKQLVRNCRTRGGDCDCKGECQAVQELSTAFLQAMSTEREAGAWREVISDNLQRASSPLAKLLLGWRDGCPAGYRCVVVFDGNEAQFWFHHQESDDWIEAPWPFDRDFIWGEDCTKNGIDFESA